MAQLAIAALILAGGQSSRMGQDKALLDVDGVPLLRRTCEVALDCTPAVSVITFWPDRYRSIVPADCQIIQEQPTSDDGESREKQGVSHGPLIGFAQGLAHIQTHVQADWVLLLACDLPNLQAETLRQWQQQLEMVSPSAIALLPERFSQKRIGENPSKKWNPLCGFYRCCCQQSLADFIEQGGRSFQGWLAQQPVQALSGVEPELLFNCNTPQDFSQIRRV